jgi:outer membrane protein TolC
VSFAESRWRRPTSLLSSANNQLQAAEANLSKAVGLSSPPQFELVDEPIRVEPLAFLENRIVRDIKVALLNVNNALERVSLTERLLEQSTLALDLAQSRYELGLSSIVEFSQAQLARTSAAIQHANAKYDYQLQKGGGELPGGPLTQVRPCVRGGRRRWS